MYEFSSGVFHVFEGENMFHAVAVASINETGLSGMKEYYLFDDLKLSKTKLSTLDYQSRILFYKRVQ